MYGLIGKKLGHSFSPYIHNRIFGYDYNLFEMSEEELARFMKDKSFSAVNVTVPYKQIVMPYLDEISDEAKEIGAVNTVINRNGKLYGYNTDCYGLTELINHNGISILGKKVLILGNGGTSKTAFYVAKKMGAGSITKVSLFDEEGCISYEKAASQHNDAEIIINTTPCGMFPKIGEAAIDIGGFDRLEAIVDVVYNPLKSKLVCDGLAKGIKSVGGLYMLVAQAAKAAELFVDRSVDLAIIDEIFSDLWKAKENIVLIGMPGSGKSTVGKGLAEKLGKSFADSDEVIAAKTGKTPAEIIKESGETEFRRIESEIIKELSASQNAVIATGGGAVLKSENMALLKENGIIVFLDRPIDNIIPTADRPLSSDRASLEKRYNERYGLYTSYCNIHIKSDESVEENIKKIIKEANYEDTCN